MEQLELRSASQGQCKYWHLVFKGGSWATFTINETTGEFSVVSDWGNYAHRWHVDHIGERDMEHFIASCNAEYIVRKFSYDEPHEFKSKFDEDKTKQGFRERIIEYRRDHTITKEEARECWNEIDKLFGRYMDGFAGPNIVYENFPGIVADLCDVHELHEWFHYSPSGKYLFLENQLIPFFQAHLRKQHEESCTPTPA